MLSGFGKVGNAAPQTPSLYALSGPETLAAKNRSRGGIATAKEVSMFRGASTD